LRATNLIDCARALLAVGQKFGPLQGIVAHSFGGMVALLTMEGGPPLTGRLDVPRIVLVSCPNRIAQITALFAHHWQLSARGLKAFERRLERVGQRAISDFTAVKLLNASGASALVVHAHDDAAVPFSAAEEIAAGAARAGLKAFDGLGHSNILFAPQVARAAVAFLKQP
jgi:pimeloyl-ACP methyl ester carboxylesterase